MGLYHIVYEYNGKQHSVYITGDGKNYIYDDAPIDSQRQQLLEEKKSAKNSMPKKTGLFLALTIICTIAALFTYGITLIGTILFGIFYFKRKRNIIMHKQTVKRKLMNLWHSLIMPKTILTER